MDMADVLCDAFGRVRDVVHDVVAGLTTDELAFRPDADANSIAWLVWHLARVQDDHVAGVAGTRQVWTEGGWVERFGLPFTPDVLGYGQTSEDVGTVRTDGELLVGYYDAVHDHTTKYLETLGEPDLGRVVDEHWDPPVTLGVRLVSVISDDLQHAGQAAYVRGLIERARRS